MVENELQNMRTLRSTLYLKKWLLEKMYVCSDLQPFVCMDRNTAVSPSEGTNSELAIFCVFKENMCIGNCTVQKKLSCLFLL